MVLAVPSLVAEVLPVALLARVASARLEARVARLGVGEPRDPAAARAAHDTHIQHTHTTQKRTALRPPSILKPMRKPTEGRGGGHTSACRGGRSHPRVPRLAPAAACADVTAPQDDTTIFCPRPLSLKPTAGDGHWTGGVVETQKEAQQHRARRRRHASSRTAGRPTCAGRARSGRSRCRLCSPTPGRAACGRYSSLFRGQILMGHVISRQRRLAWPSSWSLHRSGSGDNPNVPRHPS